ncbi:MAG TPA: hypothetical protein VLS48_07100 [Anaerolineales bacterium]|nr:hypothetical protein [Anaerolineales bacterium]
MKHTMRRVGVFLFLIVPGLCLLIVVASWLSNRGLPQEPTTEANLSSAQQARLAEADHLRLRLGEQVWPGWGQAQIPLLVYNQAYAFLSGADAPAQGWRTAPGGERIGNSWERIDEGAWGIYYRAPLPESGETPQAFTVLVGDQWAASLGTREWMRVSLRRQIQADLPPGISQVFPYRVFDAVFFNSEDWYIAALLHEAFHAFQGQVVPGRLVQAEQVLRAQESTYPWDDGDLEAGWQAELDLLAQAMKTQDETAARELAGEFLAQRQARRSAASLTPEQINYEQQREWLEGLAKYVELRIWQAAAESPDYRPVSAMESLPEFYGYQKFEQRWRQEVNQIRRMAGDEGDGRFYYSGMAQAYLLDRLGVDWKTAAFAPDMFLETLLQEAIFTPKR